MAITMNRSSVLSFFEIAKRVDNRIKTLKAVVTIKIQAMILMRALWLFVETNKGRVVGEDMEGEHE